MSTAAYILIGIVALVAAAIAVEAYLKRNRRRSLSSTRPVLKTDEVELGQEATDIELVNKTHAKNQKIERENRRRSRRHL